jgi:hypothetical protein
VQLVSGAQLPVPKKYCDKTIPHCDIISPHITPVLNVYPIEQNITMNNPLFNRLTRGDNMNPTIHEEKKCRCRFEDSFSLPENQRKYPDDDYAIEHEREALEKWHRKNLSEEWENIK